MPITIARAAASGRKGFRQYRYVILNRVSRLATLAAGITTPLFAQQVTGTARIADSHTPAAGIAIVLVSSNGVIVAGTLTRSDGQYTLRAPATGRFKVRARRIGFSPDSSDELRFDARAELHFDPVMKPVTSSLQVVSVTGTQRCDISPESGATASRLWEAAQNALSATIAAAGGEQIAFRLGRFEREVEPATGRIIRGSAWQMRALNSEPYHSVSPDSLVKTGFARSEGDSSVYFAPDARTLTSEVFAHTHCMHAVKDPSKPTQIGLAFEPVGRSRLIDVSGVLWLDRASGELRDLEYRYEFPNANQGYGAARSQESATGHIEYRQLDNGAWIVSRWIIRVPIQTEERKNTLSLNGATSDPTLRSSRGTVTTAVWEVGGDVSEVLKPGDPAFAQVEQLGQVRGSVITGPNHGGIPGVTIALTTVGNPSQSRTKQTSADGLFAFDSIPEGDYTLNVTAASLDTLNALFTPVSVRVSAGTQQTVMIMVPSPAEGRAALCPGSNPRAPVLHGLVTDSASGQPIPGARVDAYWLTGTIRGTEGGLAASAHERVTLTDSKGKYVLCDMEPTTRLLLTASIGARKSRRAPSLTLVEGGIRMTNVLIPH